MLSAILPGLRDVRVPLTAGYLWLLGLWFLLGDKVAIIAKHPPEPVPELVRLASFIGKGALLASVTFAAYLIGSFLQIDPLSRFASLLFKVLRPRSPTVSPVMQEALLVFTIDAVQQAIQVEIERQEGLTTHHDGDTRPEAG